MSAIKSYMGLRLGDGVIVSKADGRLLPPRLDLRHYSPSFEWGHSGSGPTQLALAILADYLDDDALAVDLHQEFKCVVIATLPPDGYWSLTPSTIDDAIVRIRRARGDSNAR